MMYSGLLNNVPPKGKSSKIGSVPPHNSVPPRANRQKSVVAPSECSNPKFFKLTHPSIFEEYIKVSI